MHDDEHYMAHCLELARQAEGRTSPNPLVGALVVDQQGNIVAEGFHVKAGQAHAEVNALDRAGEKARGCTLYVNLEPCCHHGKTPPCSDRVIASGIKRVVFGMIDPNPKVAGGGNQALEAAGIEVRHTILEAECRYLNRGFLKWIEHQRPWICLKIAATLDGRIADYARESRWITGVQARHYVHALRNRYDCVMIGAATAVQDDPALTVRDVANARDPLRAIVDARLDVAATSHLCTNQDGKTWLFADDKSIKQRSAQYGENVKLVATPATSCGSVAHGAQAHSDLDLAWIVNFLGGQGVRTVLCEGGARLAGSLLQKGLVDEIEWLIAPKFLCDAQAHPAVAGLKRIELNSAIKLMRYDHKQVGDDLLINGLISEP